MSKYHLFMLFFSNSHASWEKCELLKMWMSSMLGLLDYFIINAKDLGKAALFTYSIMKLL